MELIWLISLFFISFLAGLIDSIAGGGGLLMIPSLLLSGISPQFALGTNKLISSSGTSVAVFNFVNIWIGSCVKFSIKIAIYVTTIIAYAISRSEFK